MLTRFCSPIARQARKISTKQAKVKLEVKMDEETHKMIEAEEMKPRKHPGKMTVKLVELPDWLPRALEIALQDMPLSSLITDGTKLSNFLYSRHCPLEIPAIQAKFFEIKSELESKRKIESMAEPMLDEVNKKEHAQSMHMVRKAVNAWAPVQYDRYASLLYLVSRSAQNYAVLRKIFGEIVARDENFQPTSLLDFGSGVGTTIWAASQSWPKSIEEHMCVDISSDMIDLSELILSHAHPPVKRVFHRQYVPLSNKRYDIVVNAYSLMELPNLHTRLEIISKLWERTGKYLVFVEQGTNAGFKVIKEAREFILHMKEAREESNPQAAHVFSPCPHDLRCPRYSLRDDKTPCNFEASFHPLRLKNFRTPGVERYCYVVLKKGKRSEETKNWPRLVRPTLLRSKHVICRMCTTKGTLDEVIFTASKHGKFMYQCAKVSRWGDRLPIDLEEAPKSEEQPQEKAD